MADAQSEYAAGERGGTLNLGEIHVLRCVAAGRGATWLLEELSGGVGVATQNKTRSLVFVNVVSILAILAYLF
eukprot:435628-Prorocentrum_minimum.AAC.3